MTEALERRPNKAERVRLCVELMVSGRWTRAVSGPQLASELGVTVGTLEHDAAEASRVVRGLFTAEEREDLRAEILATIDRARVIASQRQDPREMRECAMAELEALGLMPKKQVGLEVGAPAKVVILPALEPLPGEEPPENPLPAVACGRCRLDPIDCRCEPQMVAVQVLARARDRSESGDENTPGDAARPNERPNE